MHDASIKLPILVQFCVMTLNLILRRMDISDGKIPDPTMDRIRKGGLSILLESTYLLEVRSKAHSIRPTKDAHNLSGCSVPKDKEGMYVNNPNKFEEFIEIL